MTARIKFGERRLDRAVAAVDDDDARGHHRHRADRFADLVDVLDLIVKDVGVRRAIFANPRQQGTVARRTWIRKERNTGHRSEEHTSELQSLMRISYAVFCLKKKNTH